MSIHHPGFTKGSPAWLFCLYLIGDTNLGDINFMAVQLELFDYRIPDEETLDNPAAYRGIYSFHKYWGKKPAEVVKYLIDHLSKENQIILDPFMGYGTTLIESVRLNRRAVGIDINPVVTDIGRLMLSPPNSESLERSFKFIENEVKSLIFDSYQTGESDLVASHYLWDKEVIKEVWAKEPGISNKKKIMIPTGQDLQMSDRFRDYRVKLLNPGIFFQNSRINTKSGTNLYDLFTGRALRNIELIIFAINKLPLPDRLPLMLVLTSSSGQMSNMVFAIQNRKSNIYKNISKTEVGSWVVGYWCPELHFEINVWNCFERRAKNLIKVSRLEECREKLPVSTDSSDIFDGKNRICVINDDCLKSMASLPEETIDLILTDPPHSDRIPYLELSNMWNIIMGKEVDFDREIGVSNAIGRNKDKNQFTKDMGVFFTEASRVLKKSGIMALMFNARDKMSWLYFDNIIEGKIDTDLRYIGHFPVKYSANSVVQDNRKGSLKDLTLIFAKTKKIDNEHLQKLSSIKGWTEEPPSGKV